MRRTRLDSDKRKRTQPLLLCVTVGLLCLAGHTLSKIKVVSPDSIKGQEIKYSLSTFGIIDYQATTVVKVFPWDDEWACKPPSDNMMSVQSDKPKAFFIRKGGCTYEEKARNAHKAGARVVIVYHDVENTKVDDDDNKAAVRPDLKIRDELPPVILVDKQTGELFARKIMGNEELQLEIDYAIGTFKTPVAVRFVYSPFDINSLEIYQGLLQLNLPAVNKTTNQTIPLTKPLIDLQAAPKIGRATEFGYGDNDIKRYCLPMSNHCVMKSQAEHHPEYQEVFLGVTLHCLHQSLSVSGSTKPPSHGYINQLIEYITTLMRMLNTSELERNIAKEFLEVISKDQDQYTKRAMECIRNGAPATFGQSESVQQDFMDKLTIASQQPLPLLPSMYIQGRSVRGDIDRVRAIGAFCDVLKKSDLPPLCFSIKEEADRSSTSILDYTPPVERISGSRAVLVFFLLSGIVVIIFYFASKYIFKSNVESDISKEIDDTLNKYYNVQSSKNQSSGIHSYKELTRNTA